MDLDELVARESIRDLVARYNANGDAGRFDPMLELFAEDAELEVVGAEVRRGRAAIRDLFESAAARSRDQGRFVRHFTATHQIDLIDADRALGRCYYVVFTNGGPDHWGRYLDEYGRVEGVWRFARRRVTVDGRVRGGWADVDAERLPG